MSEIWALGLYHSTALVEVTESLVPSNVIGHGKVHVPYQNLQLKSMTHGIYALKSIIIRRERVSKYVQHCWESKVTLEVWHVRVFDTCA